MLARLTLTSYVCLLFSFVLFVGFFLVYFFSFCFFFFSSRRRHTRCLSDWSSDVCSSDLGAIERAAGAAVRVRLHRGSIRDERAASYGAALLVLGDDRGSPRRASANRPRSEERRVGKECRARRSRYP